MVLLAITAVCSAAPASTTATKKPRQWPTTTSAELDADVVDIQTYRPPQYIKSGKGNANNVVKKFVKINRQHSKESAATATSKALDKATTTSLQYHSQSFVSANSRSTAATAATPTALPQLSALTTAARLAAATGRPSTVAGTAATAVTAAKPAASVTASPFRRVLRTSGSGHKYFANGGGSRTSPVQDSQPQASLLSKKSYTANQFVDEDDNDDYFSRRRARFLFKSRVGK